MKFSEKYGFKPAREKLQLNEVDGDLRTSLWNVMKLQVWDQLYYSQVYGGTFLTDSQNSEMTQFCRNLWFAYFKRPLDTLPKEWSLVKETLRNHFFGCMWYEIYDFLQFLAQHFPYKNKNSFIKMCNGVLEREMSGYRFVGDEISPITDSTEIDEIDQALADPLPTVRTHLKRALDLLSDRQNPDYRNSIKESISAVESLVIAKLGEKGTLGELTKKLQEDIKLHPALAKSLSSLYGYTSDGDGIRHALMDLPTLTFEDAKFLLVVCSAFVNFVEHRVPASTA